MDFIYIIGLKNLGILLRLTKLIMTALYFFWNENKKGFVNIYYLIF